MASINVRPLRDDIPYGARIAGVTRESLADESIRRQINDVFEDRGMIVFEDVEPNAQMQMMLSNVFGPPKEHPVKTTAHVDKNKLPGVITIKADPKACVVEVEGKQLVSWQPWHFDHSYNDELNRGGVLRAETVAPEGGFTAFADGIQIYRDMSPALRRKIESLSIVYTLDLLFANQKFGLPKSFREIQPKDGAILEAAKLIPRAIHPAVWTRRTGEKVAHMSTYGAKGFAGMENPEGDALFREAWAEIERTIQPYHHRWQPTDMVIWDNWRMIHMGCGCDPKYGRIMHRTTIKGDYGLGRWETSPKSAAAMSEMM